MNDDTDMSAGTVKIRAARAVVRGERFADAATKQAARTTLAAAGLDPATGEPGIFWDPNRKNTRVFGTIDKAEAKRILAAKSAGRR